MQAEVDKWLGFAAALEQAAASWVQPTCQQANDEVHNRCWHCCSNMQSTGDSVPRHQLAQLLRVVNEGQHHASYML